MLKDCMYKFYLEQNYNCAESVIRAANEYYGLGLDEKAMIMTGVYGAGIQTGNTCGAILSGAAVLSLKYVPAKAHESEDIKPVTTKFIREFNQIYGGIRCTEIKPKSFKTEYRCLKTVECVCDTLEKVIAEYEAAKKDN